MVTGCSQGLSRASCDAHPSCVREDGLGVERTVPAPIDTGAGTVEETVILDRTTWYYLFCRFRYGRCTRLRPSWGDI
jgi:hypothetical protein